MASIFKRFSRLFGGSGSPESAQSSHSAGDVFSVTCDDGLFGVVKLLATEDEGVHVRLYVQRFERRPVGDDLGVLSLAGFGPGFDNPMSVGHMPIAHRAFASWEPVFIRREVVTDDELEGYRMWQEAQGGFFG